MPQSAKRKKAGKEILLYIEAEEKKEKPKNTKADVMRYCEKNSICSQPVAHSVVISLVKRGKIKILKDKPNSQVHHLVINYENEFHVLTNKIGQIEKLVNALTSAVVRGLSIINHINNTGRIDRTQNNIRDTHFRNLIHMAQLTIYGRTTAIVTAIEKNIKSIDDRESLYLHLPGIMSASNELNKIIMPEVLKSYKHHYEQLRPIGPTYFKIITGIIDIMK
jgi:hypothetical protein